MLARGCPRSPRCSWVFFVSRNDSYVDLRGRLVRPRVGGGVWA